MKIKSTHVVVLTAEELANRLGFDGITVEAVWNKEEYMVTIEGDVQKPSMLPGPVIVAPTAPPMEVGEKPQAELTVKFYFAPEYYGPASAYAQELKTEVMKMLSQHPEAGVSTVTGLTIG